MSVDHSRILGNGKIIKSNTPESPENGNTMTSTADVNNEMTSESYDVSSQITKTKETVGRKYCLAK